MKTFLPQNQFNSASPVVDDAAASSSPLPHDAAAALSSSDGGVKESPASIPDYNGVKSPALVTAHGLSGKSCPLSQREVGSSEAEAAASVRTVAVSDLDQLANYFRRHESGFVPDKEAMWDAMFDETAPRVRAGDPVWADDAPMFLRLGT